MPEFKHFDMVQIASGVWASIHKSGGWAIGNAGIVDLGDQTLVFDTHMTPSAGEDLRKAAEALTGRPAAIVILSHFHNDHIWGAQAFRPEATIYATHENKTLIETQGREEYDYFKRAAPERLAELEEQAGVGTSDSVMEMMLAYYSGIVQSMPVLQVQSPEVTFTERLVFQGPLRQVEVLTYGGGHTGSDAFLYLPADGIAFLSDLFFVGTIPFLADGNPWEKLRILEKIETLGAHTLVPGHGPVAGPEQVLEMKTYISMVDRAVAESVEAGRTLAQILADPIPAPFAGWDFSVFHTPNVRYFYRHYGDDPDAAESPGGRD